MDHMENTPPMGRDELAELTARIALLMKTYEESTTRIADTALINVENLDRSIRLMNDEMQSMIMRAEEKIKDSIDRAVGTAMEAKVVAFEERLHKGLREVDYDISEISKARIAMAQQTKILTWKAIVFFSIGACVLLGTLMKVGWEKKTTLAEMEARYKRLEYSAGVKEALKTLTITSCGGTPCIRLDEAAKRWGKDGEYILTK